MSAYRSSPPIVAENSTHLPAWRGSTIHELVSKVDGLDLSTPPPAAPAPATLKFDAAFLERRMLEHKQWQKFHEQVTAAGIIQEVLEVAEALDELD